LAASLFASLPLARGIPRGHDIGLHFFRLVELDHLVRQGLWYTRWLPDLVYGYGYPLFNFYAPLSAYLALAWRILGGLSFHASLSAALATCFVLAGLGMFAFTRRRWGTGPAVIASVAYIFAPYTLYNTYVRGSLSDALAMALFPIVAWAFQRLLSHLLTPTLSQGERELRLSVPEPFSHGTVDLVLAGASYAALTLSHNVSSLSFTPILGLYVLWLVLTAPQRRSAAIRAGAALALGLGLSAFFWLPALAEKSATRIDWFVALVDYDFHYNFESLREMFASPGTIYTGLMNPLVPRSLSLAQIALVALAILTQPLNPNDQTPNSKSQFLNPKSKKSWSLGFGHWSLPDKGEILLFSMALAGLVFMMLRLSTPVWEMIPLARYFEFPWRLLAPASFALAVLVGAASARLFTWAKGRAPILAAGILAVLITTTLPYLYLPTQFGFPAQPTLADVTTFQTKTGALGSTSSGEYIPAIVTDEPLAPPFPGADLGAGLADKLDRAALPPDATVSVERNEPLRTRLIVESPQAFQAPFFTFQFPGWQAKIDGMPAPVLATGPLGRLTMDVPAGRHTVEIYFGETPVRQVANLISLASALILVVVAMLRLRSAQALVASVHQKRLKSLLRTIDQSPGDATSGKTVLAIALTLVILFVLKIGYLDNFESPVRRTFDPARLPAGTQAVDWDFGGELRLVGYRAEPIPVGLGQSLRVTLYWQSTHELTEDYTPHIRLVNSNGIAYSQVSHLHVAELPTSRWPPGEFAEDRFVLDIPPDAWPGEAFVEVNVLLAQGKQVMWLPVPGSIGPDMQPGHSALVGPVRIVGQPARGLDHPLQTDFPIGIRLLDYSVEREDKRLHVSFTWQALADLSTNYTVFVHGVGLDGQLMAQHDSYPRNGMYPTRWWRKGDLIEDRHELTLPADVPVQVYVGLYHSQSRERVRTEDGRDIVYLPIWSAPTNIQPANARFREPPISSEIDLARLVGYTIEYSTPGALRVVLYWQAEGAGARPYTVFVHALDASGELIAQHDGPPARSARPTNQWLAGEIIPDPHDIPVTPETAARIKSLAVGLYDADGNRLFARDFSDKHYPDDRVLLPVEARP